MGGYHYWLMTASTDGKWIVWSVERSGFAPETRRYATEAAALQRAREMASANPGYSFYVANLQSVSRLPAQSVTTTQL